MKQIRVVWVVWRLRSSKKISAQESYDSLLLRSRKWPCSKLPVQSYLLKINSKSTRTIYEICSKLTINTPERSQWRRSSIFIVNFEHISHLALLVLWLTLSRQKPAGLNQFKAFQKCSISHYSPHHNTQKHHSFS